MKTTLDSCVSRYYQERNEHPVLKDVLGGRDEKLISRGLDIRDRAVSRLGGIPRLERDIAPANAESNDLYQFRIASVLHGENPNKRGSFVMYYRNPTDLGGVVLAGIQHAIDTVNNFKFDPRFLAKLLSEHKITPGLYNDLLALDRLDVSVEAIPEGTFVGPDTPVMTVTGPIWQVQLMETVLLGCIDYPTGVTTRAAAIIEASQGKMLVDFGTRRAPGEQAAVLSAFSSVKGGATSVANTLTSYLSTRIKGEEYIPDSGTTSHSFTESYLLFDEDGNAIESPATGEENAYSTWVKYFPEATCVLIDTIDKKVGLKTTARIYEKFGFKSQNKPIGVRDDSAITSQSILFVFDELIRLGVEKFFIVISDNLTPQKVRELREGIVKARGQKFWNDLDIRFGVGTFLARPEPVGFVFKLAQYEEDGQTVPVAKRSGTTAKASFPVAIPHRIQDESGAFVEDLHLHPSEDADGVVEGTKSVIHRLSEIVFERGSKTQVNESSASIAKRCRDQLGRLPSRVLNHPTSAYRPRFSQKLDGIRSRIQEALSKVS
ncbi:MAG: hypothetical protein WCT46_02905 [Candidatus Gracilibacteria bacterium]